MLPQEFKILISLASIAVALLIVFFVTAEHHDSGTGWARGKRNLVRRALYTPDGTFRKNSKAMLVAYLAVFNLLIWALL